MSVPLREFTSADEMREFYRELIARRNSLGPPPPESEPEPDVEKLEPEPEPPPPLPSSPPQPPALAPAAPSPCVRQIIRAVAEEFAIPPEVALGPGRDKKTVELRHVTALLAHDLTKLSSVAIGHALGRDHSTILFAIQSMRHRVAGDPVLAARIGRLRQKLKEQ